MPSLSTRLFLIVLFVTCFGLVVGGVRAAETDPDGRLYEPSEDPVADVQQAMVRAEESDRRALVVMGANWCHDSRALAARLYRSPLKEVIEEHYELLFVDVGFYEISRDVVQQLGIAHYYATPTVLIIDPSSGKPINGEDRHIWSNAYKVDMPLSVEYFEKWAVSDLVADPAADSEDLRQLYAEIDRFEQQLAERVAVGYAVVGPMLEATVAGNRPDDFDARWDELAEFRMAIPGVIRSLRQEAQRRAAEAEDDEELVLPDFPLLPWETE